MSRISESPGARLLDRWARLSPLPGGPWLFTRLLGRTVPYTDTIGATVVALAPGRARVQMHDRRKVRNHLGSVHAIALANLAELSTGLAVLTCLPRTVRGILTGIEMAYTKKARGRLTAEAQAAVGEVTEPAEYEVRADIVDSAGDVVATGRALWLLSPR